MKVIASYSIKGGVGKTTTAVNLAYAAAQQGHRTILIDLDAQSAASYFLRVRPHRNFKHAHLLKGKSKLLKSVRASDYENLDILPAHDTYRNMDIVLSELKGSKKRLSRAVAVLRDEFDVAVLDTTPTISLLAENVFRISDIILVPVIPTKLSQRTLDQLLQFLDEQGDDCDRVTPFFSMVQGRSAMHRYMMASLRTQHPAFLETTIPQLKEIERMSEQREPVMAMRGANRGAEAFTMLWQEVAERIGNRALAR